jgi:hypothetical protein
MAGAAAPTAEEHCSITITRLRRDRRRAAGRGILGNEAIRETNWVASIVRHLGTFQIGDRWNVIGRAYLQNLFQFCVADSSFKWRKLADPP